MWTERRSGQAQHRLNDHRNPYERDLTRIIHSPSFRRLQRKTQIHSTNTGDFHRTRLTHSLEVASIARSIVRHLNATIQDNTIQHCLPDDDLISAIALLHDIGHPPFGHGGETALHYAMRSHGGFESNAQTLHLVTKTETSYGAYGLDLTRRTLLGVLKYPTPLDALMTDNVEPGSNLQDPTSSKKQALNVFNINHWIPPKGYYTEDEPEVSWILTPFSPHDRAVFQSTQDKKTIYRSFDCAIMDLADDIAYGVHDLEDAIHLQLISRDLFDTQALRDILHLTTLDVNLLDNLFSAESVRIKTAIGDLVHYCITQTHPAQENSQFENLILRHSVTLPPEALALITYLKQFIHTHVIDSLHARQTEHQGQMILLDLFHHLKQEPETLLDMHHQQRYQHAANAHEAMRAICDYIANMSDEEARIKYAQLK